MAPLSKKDQEIMNRLVASGYAINDVQLHAPFRFLVRPFKTTGVEVGRLAAWFEEEVFSDIKNIDFQSPIAGIAIFPTIFDNAIAPTPKDYVKYKRSEKIGICSREYQFLIVGCGVPERTTEFAGRQHQAVHRTDSREISIESRS